MLDKYDEYYEATGIDRQSSGTILEETDVISEGAVREVNAAFLSQKQSVTDMLVDFAEERDWVKFDTPRNLTLAMTNEVGELIELFQWRRDEDTAIDLTELDAMAQELADVAIYLLRLIRTVEQQPM